MHKLFCIVKKNALSLWRFKSNFFETTNTAVCVKLCFHVAMLKWMTAVIQFKLANMTETCGFQGLTLSTIHPDCFVWFRFLHPLISVHLRLYWLCMPLVYWTFVSKPLSPVDYTKCTSCFCCYFGRACCRQGVRLVDNLQAKKIFIRLKKAGKDQVKNDMINVVIL